MMSLYQIEILVRSPEGIVDRKTIDTTAKSVKDVCQRLRNATDERLYSGAVARLLEGIESPPEEETPRLEKGTTEPKKLTREDAEKVAKETRPRKRKAKSS